MNLQEKLKLRYPVSLENNEFREIRNIIFKTHKLCFALNKKHLEQKAAKKFLKLLDYTQSPNNYKRLCMDRSLEYNLPGITIR